MKFSQSKSNVKLHSFKNDSSPGTLQPSDKFPETIGLLDATKDSAYYRVNNKVKANVIT